MTGLVLKDVSARYRHGPPVVRGVSLTAAQGRITALLGPNGSGKSTLIRAVLGLTPASGTVLLDGVNLWQLDRIRRAQRVAYVPQRTQLFARLSVRSVVAQGRFAHAPSLAPWSRGDDAHVAAALDETDTRDLAERPFPELSGGEQARVMLARALATQATTLLLDEPTASLDVRQGLLLHAILRRLAQRACTVLIVMHDLAEVRRHADDAVLLCQGRVYGSGSVREVIASEPVRSVYGVELMEGGALSWRLPERVP